MSLCLSVSFALMFAGCAGKNVTSSSGDEASRAGQNKAEVIQSDAIKTVPLERSFDRPGGSVPSNLALAPGTASSSSPLGDAFFDYDRFSIRVDAMPVLDTNSGWLRANGNKTVLIEGHCDERGTLAYNLVLGEKRAQAAKKYLIEMGIPASQLLTTSYGETRPFCKQRNEDCYQQNRRAHFVMK
jgi:peptidoglycan-associated lipoprotein